MNPPRAGNPIPRPRLPSLFALGLFALAALAPAVALARTSDRNQPMTLDSDSSDCNQGDADSRCVFSGNVVIVQGTLEIRADRAEVVQRGGEIDQVILTGRQAAMKQQMDDGTMMNARADRIVFEPGKELLTLTGDFKIESPRGSNSGQRMVYNMGTGQMQSGGDGTRVRTVIQPKAPATPARPAAPATPEKGSN
ncbi:lipopolysaccharide transport periplasmic protein LptA [Pseudoxanthomonas koreensis]|uniref:lipopolysaccharide transport periplasmic protein LptA n=1 Tax=Pseudoxanthomonas koreensis TaxID=266061 RepID=UPI0013915E97|nr:lipopolysaccharide transport periplasmic protein LptA [Pseudoxanthomonas koreensis]KAF1691181.1 lipopolysaccharide transport periplasmic protein LptA [Pseudoxanthomonas koreensis]